MLWKITSFLRITGLLLAAYGLIRQVFGDMAYQKGFGDLHGEGQLGQIMVTVQEMILRLGIKANILMFDHPLTIADKRINTELAVVGFSFLVLAVLIDIAVKIKRRF